MIGTPDPQRLEKLANQPEPLSAHVLLAPLSHQILVPIRVAVDPAPVDLLLRSDVARLHRRHANAMLPFAEFEARYQLDFQAASFGSSARRNAIIVIR